MSWLKKIIILITYKDRFVERFDRIMELKKEIQNEWDEIFKLYEDIKKKM